MDIGEIFLSILEVVSNAITTLVGMLPNPDPFPAIIQQLNIDTSDQATFAFYWLNNFVDLPMITGILAAYFTMFGLAWIIMMLWKWLKAR